MRYVLTILVVACFIPAVVAAVPATDEPGFKSWIEEMKQAQRGPFKRIRWYCNDGSVLDPEPYACVERDGGLQHGEWNQKASQLRESGYLVANVLAVYSEKNRQPPDSDLNTIKQIMLEQFLVGYDDGWILRNARYYRGAFQIADEIKGSQALLRKLVRETGARDQNYLLLMEANRLLPQKGGSALATRMRDKATILFEEDVGFERLRSKLHTQPEASDASRIRDYIRQQEKQLDKTEYLVLADLVDQLFRPGDLVGQLRKMARSNYTRPLKKQLLLSAETLDATNVSAEIKLLETSHLLAELREYCFSQSDSKQIDLLRLAQTLEQVVFVSGSELQSTLAEKTRLERLGWLRSTAQSIYGLGFISSRQWQAVKDSLNRLEKSELTVGQYQAELRYLNRLPAWSSRWLAYHFKPGIEHLEKIEPLIVQFIPARLRGSPLQFYTAVLDSLLRDANFLAGMENKLFDETSGTEMRPLNAGLARGRLLVKSKDNPMDENGIYLLPETTMELTPVAGILTQGEGNALSHVQLLAANLGIPNVVVDENIIGRLHNRIGQNVVLAVSAGGVVQLAIDDRSWDERLNQEVEAAEDRIDPDLTKLNLLEKHFQLLSKLRAVDSGRIVGPKAANLGELKFYFPEAVVEGLVISFGIFREVLEQPAPEFNGTLFEWMQVSYQSISQLEAGERNAAASIFLGALREKILQTRLSAAFKKQLKDKLEATFGEDGTYAVFVRSDTNVEDLPGFTGAGLNLTVPNVVGFEQIADAIVQVWASPFSERAYAWRQGRMSYPEHVYPSVILMKTVAVEKSGVLITQDTETGNNDWLSIATNHGIGGAVQGQAAEELRLHRETGEVRLLADATSPMMRLADRTGGLKTRAAPATGIVLEPDEIQQLVEMVRRVSKNVPQYNHAGEKIAADIEFGFEKGKLRLFQVRPYLRSQRARNNQYLIDLDRDIKARADVAIKLSEVP